LFFFHEFGVLSEELYQLHVVVGYIVNHYFLTFYLQSDTIGLMHRRYASSKWTWIFSYIVIGI